jgi:hypothetical protein
VSFALDRDGELARHVHAALEDEAAQPLRHVQERAPEGCDYFSELEASLGEWSFGYGVAWALARVREPFASSQRLAKLADEAVRGAWRALDGESWTTLMGEDRAARGPVDGEAGPSQLEDFMGKVARTRPSRRPRWGEAAKPQQEPGGGGGESQQGPGEPS